MLTKSNLRILYLPLNNKNLYQNNIENTLPEILSPSKIQLEMAFTTDLDCKQ